MIKYRCFEINKFCAVYLGLNVSSVEGMKTSKKLNKEPEDPYTFQSENCYMVMPGEEIRLYNRYNYRYDWTSVNTVKDGIP